MLPEKELELKLRETKYVRFPKVKGMEPENMFMIDQGIPNFGS